MKERKIKKLFELSEHNMIDKITENGAKSYSIANFKHEEDAKDYIKILKKKYNILEEELSLDNNDYYCEPAFFKEINIIPTKVIEKKRKIGLYLCQS